MESLTAPLVRARDEGRDAFGPVVRLAAPSVAQFVAFEVDPEEIDDVVLAVFVRAWSALPRFRAETNGEVWLLTIARRTCRGVVRRRIRHILRHGRAKVRRRTAAAEPLPRLEINERIARLAPDRRQAFVLTQFVGLSYCESGQVCGVPAATIGLRVVSARSELIGYAMD